MRHINYKLVLSHIIDGHSQDILNTFYYKKKDALEAFNNYEEEDGKIYLLILYSVLYDEAKDEYYEDMVKSKTIGSLTRYGYQAVHDNCEPYEDNYTEPESIIYTDKQVLVKRLLTEGYYQEDKDTTDTIFIKELNKDYQRFDKVEITKVIIEESSYE